MAQDVTTPQGLVKDVATPQGLAKDVATPQGLVTNTLLIEQPETKVSQQRVESIPLSSPEPQVDLGQPPYNLSMVRRTLSLQKAKDPCTAPEFDFHLREVFSTQLSAIMGNTPNFSIAQCLNTEEYDLLLPDVEEVVYSSVLNSPTKILSFIPPNIDFNDSASASMFKRLIEPMVKACYFQHSKALFYIIIQPKDSSMLSSLRTLVDDTGGNYLCVGANALITDDPQPEEFAIMTNLPQNKLLPLFNARNTRFVRGEDVRSEVTPLPSELLGILRDIFISTKDDVPTHFDELTTDDAIKVHMRKTEAILRSRRPAIISLPDSCAQQCTLQRSDWSPLSLTSRTITLVGFGGSEVTSPIGSACSTCFDVNNDKYLLVINEAALQSDNPNLTNLFDNNQLRANGWKVDDCDALEISRGGIRFPLHVHGSDLVLKSFYPTPQEIDDLERLEMTPNCPWDRASFISGEKTRTFASVRPIKAKTKELNPRIFPFLSPETRRLTMECTTQLAIVDLRRDVPKSFKPNPALTKNRVDELLSMDTIYAKHVSREGTKMSELFVYTTSKYLFVFPLKLRSEVSTALVACMIAHGIPKELRNDNAKENVSAKLEALLRDYMVKHSFSDPYNQHRNPSERWVGYIVRRVILILEHSGAPPVEWWSALMYAVYVHNRTANRNLGWKTPISCKDGYDPDISEINVFAFYQPIWYKSDPDDSNISTPRMTEGRYLRPAENTGGTYASIIRKTDGGEICRTQIRPMPFISSSQASQVQEECGRPPSTAFDDEISTGAPIEDDWEDDEIPSNHIVQDEPNQVTAILIEQPPEEVEEEHRYEEEDQEEEPQEKRMSGEEVQANREEELMRAATTTSEPSIDDNPSNQEPTQSEDNNGEEEEFSAVGREIGKRRWFKQDDIALCGTVKKDYIDNSGTRRIDIEFAGSAENLFISYQDYLDGIVEPNSEEDQFEILRITGTREAKRANSSVWIWQVSMVFGDGGHEWVDYESAQEDVPLMLAEYLLTIKPRRKGGKLNKFLIAQVEWAKKVTEEFEKTRSVQVLRLMALPYRFETKFGVRCPQGMRSAMALDKELDASPDLSASVGHQRWQGAIDKEKKKFFEHQAFDFLKEGVDAPASHQRMRCHFVFDVKADGTFKARFVAGGNSVDSTGIPSSMSVVETAHTRILFAITSGNGQNVLIGDLASAYLHANSIEKVFFICGPEWGEYEGRVAIVLKAVYGLVGSAHAYHRHVFDVMQGLGWKPCSLANDIWIRKDKEGKLYDYIAFYVDDFIIVSNHPAELATELGEIFSIKEIGPPSRYLGADVRWVEGYFQFSSSTYVIEILGQLQRAGSLEEQPGSGFRKFRTPYDYKHDDNTPLPPGDHPEEDDSELLDDAGHHLYQRMVGILQWIVLIGRYDICFATSSMSRFGSAPKQGHLDRVRRIFGYLRANPHKAIRINPSPIGNLPSPLAEDIMENMRKAYPDAKEELNSSDPIPLGKPLPITVFVDADHAHDTVTRRSITGLLAFVGCTPVYAKSKRQTSVESSTYGAEFTAARSAVEYLIGTRLLMRALGVPVEGPSVLLGDNRGVVESASSFTTVLIKKHNAISYHRVREAVAGGIVDFRWIDGENNLADLMTKPVTKVTHNRLTKEFMF